MAAATTTTAATVRKTRQRKASIYEKLVFGTGGLYNGAINIFNFYYAIFVTDVIGLNPLYVGPVFLLSKIWDAFTDPIMGNISDTSKSKNGRRRPFFLFGTIPVFISFVLLFNPVRFKSDYARFFYVLFSCLLFRTVYTMVMIPHQASKAEISLEYGDRNTVNFICMMFSSVASIAGIVLPICISGISGDTHRAYVLIAFGLGLFFALPWPFIYMIMKPFDRFKPVVRHRRGLWKMYLAPLKIKAFRYLMGMFLMVVVSLNMMSTLFVYYLKFFLINRQSFSLTSIAVPVLLALLFQVLLIPLYLKISRKSKSRAFILASMLWCAGNIFIFFFRPGMPVSALCIPGALTGAGIAGVMLMVNSMLSDVTDVGEMYYGERKEGAFSGMFLFIKKTSTAFSQFMVLTALGMSGYVASTAKSAGRTLVSAGASQPASVMTVIRVSISIAPVLFLACGIIIALRYPVNAKVHHCLSKYLSDRRDGMPANPEIERDLYRELGIKNDGHTFYRTVVFLLKLFYPPHKVTGTQNVKPGEPGVFVTNHSGAYGPMVMQLFFPYSYRPWVIYKAVLPQYCKNHLEKVFLRKETGLKKPFNKWLATLIAPLCLKIMRSVRAIPVYRGSASIRKTFSKSTESLEEGCNIVIFPEKRDSRMKKHVKRLYSGFVYTAKQYYRKTGKRLLFYPVYAYYRKRTIAIGKPVRYSPDNSFKNERQRISQCLYDSMNDIAKTVINN